MSGVFCWADKAWLERLLTKMTKKTQKTGKARRLRTNLVRGGVERTHFQETSEALFLTSGYVYDRAEDAEAAFKQEIDRFMYSRFGNPTVSMFQDRMALIEGAEACWGTATGMAAVTAALLCQLKTGDRVVAARALFGSCQYVVTEILPRFGIESVIVDGGDLDQWKQALGSPTQAVFLETPSNPTLEIVDLPAVCEMAHISGAKVIVDNVFATPILQKPLELGADIVIYSGTKHIDGQGRCMGGAVLGDAEFCEETLKPFIRNTGPSLSPFNAWVLLKGLETLELRVEKQSENALQIARFLEDQPKVSRVLYPGLESHPQFDLAARQMSGGGTMVSFELGEEEGDAGKASAFKFENALEIIDISNNLGDTKSLITHPPTTTHQRVEADERARMGIRDNLLRISVGLEDIEDLKEDLGRGLAVV